MAVLRRRLMSCGRLRFCLSVKTTEINPIHTLFILRFGTHKLPLYNVCLYFCERERIAAVHNGIQLLLIANIAH
jgi:hypothetical protein